jgi:HEPN domain-containing protein
MKRQTSPWVRKAEDDVHAARELAALKPPLVDIVNFHCQQAIEKYLNAFLQEQGVAFPKTHDLSTLLKLVLPLAPKLKHFRVRFRALTRYAVEYRYPIVRATARQMHSALRTMERGRGELREFLGLLKEAGPSP